MALPERICERVRELPDRLQAEVLDFVEYLLCRSQTRSQCDDDRAWSAFSLASAMRGMEEEEETPYTLDDVKERFA